MTGTWNFECVLGVVGHFTVTTDFSLTFKYLHLDIWNTSRHSFCMFRQQEIFCIFKIWCIITVFHNILFFCVCVIVYVCVCVVCVYMYVCRYVCVCVCVCGVCCVCGMFLWCGVCVIFLHLISSP